MADIEIAFEPPLARIVLNRPSRRNALNLAMWRALVAAVDAIAARPDVRAVLVEGAGDDFCSGADVTELDTAFATLESAREYQSAIESCLTTLARLDRPTIALIEGATIGAGLAVALACDLRFSAEDVHIAVPPAKLGLVYNVFESRRLVELIGPSRAKDLVFSARRVDAKEALAIGLIDRRLPRERLHAEALGYARELCAMSRTSLRGAKELFAGLAEDRDEGALQSIAVAAALGEDFKEGHAAFRDKRKAKFL